MKLSFGRKLVGKSAISQDDTEEKEDSDQQPKLKLPKPSEDLSFLMTFLEPVPQTQPAVKPLGPRSSRTTRTRERSKERSSSPRERDTSRRGRSQERKNRSSSRERKHERNQSCERKRSLSKDRRRRSESKDRTKANTREKRNRSNSRDRHVTSFSKEKKQFSFQERRSRKSPTKERRVRSVSRDRIRESTSKEKKVETVTSGERLARSPSKEKQISAQRRSRSVSKEKIRTRSKDETVERNLSMENKSRRSLSKERSAGSPLREGRTKRSLSREKRLARSSSRERRKRRSRSRERKSRRSLSRERRAARSTSRERRKYRNDSMDRRRKRSDSRDRRTNRSISPDRNRRGNDYNQRRRTSPLRRQSSRSPKKRRSYSREREKRFVDKAQKRSASTSSSSSSSSSSSTESDSESPEPPVLEEENDESDVKYKTRYGRSEHTRSDSVDGTSQSILNESTSKGFFSSNVANKDNVNQSPEPPQLDLFMEVDEEISFKYGKSSDASNKNKDRISERQSSPVKSTERSSLFEKFSPEKLQTVKTEEKMEEDKHSTSERPDEKSEDTEKGTWEKTPIGLYKYSPKKSTPKALSPVVKLFNISPKKGVKMSIFDMMEKAKEYESKQESASELSVVSAPETVEHTVTSSVHENQECVISAVERPVEDSNKANSASDSKTPPKRLTRKQAAESKVVLPPVMSKDMPTRGKRGRQQSQDSKSRSESPVTEDEVSAVEMKTKLKSDEIADSTVSDGQEKVSSSESVAIVETEDIDIKQKSEDDESENRTGIQDLDIKTLQAISDKKNDFTSIPPQPTLFLIENAAKKPVASNTSEIKIEDIPMPPASIDENKNTLVFAADEKKIEKLEQSPKSLFESEAQSNEVVDMDLDDSNSPQNIEIIQPIAIETPPETPKKGTIQEVKKEKQTDIHSKPDNDDGKKGKATQMLKETLLKDIKGFSLKLAPSVLRKPQQLEDVFETGTEKSQKLKPLFKYSPLPFGPPEFTVAPKPSKNVITTAIATSSFKPVPPENVSKETSKPESDHKVEEIGASNVSQNIDVNPHEKDNQPTETASSSSSSEQINETASKPISSTNASETSLVHVKIPSNPGKLPQISPEQIGKAIQVIGQENLRRIEVLQRASAKITQGRNIEVVGQKQDLVQVPVIGASTSAQNTVGTSNMSQFEPITNPQVPYSKPYEEDELQRLEREKEQLLHMLQSHDSDITDASGIQLAVVDKYEGSEKSFSDYGDRPRSGRDTDDYDKYSDRDRNKNGKDRRPSGSRSRKDDDSDYDDRRNSKRDRRRSRDRDTYRGRDRGRSRERSRERERDRDRSRERRHKRKHRNDDKYESRRRKRSRSRSWSRERDRRSRSRDRRSRSRDRRSRSRDRDRRSRSRDRDRRSRSRERGRRSRSRDRRSRSRDRRSRSRERHRRRRSNSRTKERRSRSRDRDSDRKKEEKTKESALEKFEKELAEKKKVLLQPVTPVSQTDTGQVMQPVQQAVPVESQQLQQHFQQHLQGQFASVDPASAHFLPQPFPVHQQQPPQQMQPFPVGIPQAVPEQVQQYSASYTVNQNTGMMQQAMVPTPAPPHVVNVPPGPTLQYAVMSG